MDPFRNWCLSFALGTGKGEKKLALLFPSLCVFRVHCTLDTQASPSAQTNHADTDNNRNALFYLNSKARTYPFATDESAIGASQVFNEKSIRSLDDPQMVVRNGCVIHSNVIVRGSSDTGGIPFQWKRLILVWPSQNIESRHGGLFLKTMDCGSQGQIT
jgi:hypothetical protein